MQIEFVSVGFYRGHITHGKIGIHISYNFCYCFCSQEFYDILSGKVLIFRPLKKLVGILTKFLNGQKLFFKIKFTFSLLEKGMVGWNLIRVGQKCIF